MKETGDNPRAPGAKSGYITVRASDLVSPPYVKCPKCGEDTFGVICIAAHQYSRRCKKCLYPSHPEWHEPTRLPALDKRVIYLDQFVISNMMFALNSATKQHGKGAHEESFREMFKSLDRLGKEQLLVCPSSEFHDSESLTSRDFETLKRMYELLSYGVRWHQVDSVRACLIVEAFRHWDAGRPPQRTKFTKDDFLYGDRTGWTDRFYVSSDSRCDENLVEEIRQTRDAVAEELRSVFEGWQGDEDKTFNDWVLEETQGAARKYVRGLFRQFDEVAVAQSEISRTQEVTLSAAEAFMPTHETRVMMGFRDALMKRGCDEGQWLPRACEFLQSEHFAVLPFVRIGSMIWATIANRAAHSGQKRLPTRGFHNDVGFISTFLPFCDAMFLDKESHGILDDSVMNNVLAEYGTRVYSLRDKEGFLAYLKDIENAATREHVNTLDEVYGDRYLKSYLELYDSVAPSDINQGRKGAGDTTGDTTQ